MRRKEMEHSDASSAAVERVPRWSDAVKALALPPAGLFALALAGSGLLAGGFERAGLAVLGASLAALYLLSVPWTGGWLITRLDRFPPLEPDRLDPEVPTALVVLDAGRRRGAGEYGGDALKPMTLERLAYTAWLWRLLRLPILVSGDGAGALMSTYLDQLFEVPVRWIEPTSHNTHENAVRTAEILGREKIGRVVLVTHYWHMPRAAAAFSNAGLEVVPAPMGLTRCRGSWEKGLLSLVPSPTGWTRSYLAIHEGLGLLWYRWR